MPWQQTLRSSVVDRPSFVPRRSSLRGSIAERQAAPSRLSVVSAGEETQPDAMPHEPSAVGDRRCSSRAAGRVSRISHAGRASLQLGSLRESADEADEAQKATSASEDPRPSWRRAPRARASVASSAGGRRMSMRASLRLPAIPVVNLELERLRVRTSYTCKRFAAHAPYWQFVVWFRQLALTVVSLLPGIFAAAGSQLEEEYVRGESEADSLLWAQTFISCLVLLIAMVAHMRIHPFLFHFQNHLETWLLISSIVLIILAFIYTITVGTTTGIVLEAVLTSVLLASLIATATYLIIRYRREMRSMAEARLRQIAHAISSFSQRASSELSFGARKTARASGPSERQSGRSRRSLSVSAVSATLGRTNVDSVQEEDASHDVPQLASPLGSHSSSASIMLQMSRASLAMPPPPPHLSSEPNAAPPAPSCSARASIDDDAHSKQEPSRPPIFARKLSIEEVEVVAERQGTIHEDSIEISNVEVRHHSSMDVGGSSSGLRTPVRIFRDSLFVSKGDLSLPAESLSLAAPAAPGPPPMPPPDVDSRKNNSPQQSERWRI